MDKKAREIIKEVITPEMSTVQKVKAVHDYIVLNCEYDYSNYAQGTIPNVSYDAKGVLIKRKAVCQGYAEAFKLLMDMLQIPCKLVSGQADNGSGNGYNGHAWNIVKVDGKWYQIDVTWDDPVPDEKGFVRYDYFLIPDSKMDDDHKWKRSKYNKCVTDNSAEFIKLIGEVSETMEDAVALFYNDYEKNQGTEATLIVNKNIYDEMFGYRLFDALSQKYGIIINSWSCTTQTEYGDYMIIRYYSFNEHYDDYPLSYSEI